MSDENDTTKQERFNEAVTAARILKNLHSRGHLHKDITDVYEILTESQRKEIVLGFIEGLAVQELADEEARNLHPSVLAELEHIRKEDKLSLIELKEFFTKTLLISLSLLSVLTLVGFFFLGTMIDKVGGTTDWLLRVISEMLGI